MLIIGERINSSRKPIEQAVSLKDADFLIKEARLQIESGADFVDVNCAVRIEKEKEDLTWLIKTIQSNLDIPISIDSPDPEVIEGALKIHKKKAFVNSITAETEKLRRMLDIVKGKDVFVIALTMDDKGAPHTSLERLRLAKHLINSLKEAHIPTDNIYVDPLVKPISSEPDQVKEFLETIKQLKQSKIKTIGGLSNVSYGLPARRVLNAVFFSLAIEAGIDAVIIDPTDELIRGEIKAQAFTNADAGQGLTLSKEAFKLAKEALLGEDAYCMNYIKAFREGKLVV